MHLTSLRLPDLWQQTAVRALREGRDVVVDAPTGAGKTYIFELLHSKLPGQAIYTVPTRALANDKVAEWRAQGWDVGICTGDIAERLDAPVLVATLETQKASLLRQRGPALLVIDEYQLIGDSLRGVSYELAIALAPASTQLLLLSGSVANPQDIVTWLTRLGRKAVLVQHRERPVPLEEVDLETLPDKAPASVRGWWPRHIANALAADLGPILIFAPRRKAAEQMAAQLAAALPGAGRAALDGEQQQLAGASLASLLRRGVAYHHSGLSYAQRAGLIEPLAKAGKLRVVVATMGLAAGINFSMRSVAISGTSYHADQIEREVRPDELLQMYGRAGRRGLDDMGYALLTPQPPRLLDARPLTLRRADPLDWPTLLAVMDSAPDPFAAALAVNRRLFTPRSVPLGIEHARATGPMACGFAVDAERARFFRRGTVEMQNSHGKWQPRPEKPATALLGQALIWVQQATPPDSAPVPCSDKSPDRIRWVPALAKARTLEGRGFGTLCKLPGEQGKRYGRELVLGTRRSNGTLQLSPWLKARVAKAIADFATLEADILPRLAEWSGGRLLALEPRGEQLIARFSYHEVSVKVWIDEHGAALLDPPERRALPPPCRACAEQSWCRTAEITTSPAHVWRTLGLIEPDGHLTRRGVIFSYFHHAEGFAIAVALEEESYPIAELVFDLANLRAGPRFAGEDSPYAGRLGHLSQQASQRAEHPGYLTLGVPVDYGAGASEAMRAHVEFGVPRSKLLSESLRLGDFERAYVEWRALLRHIVWSPDCDWARWRELQASAAHMLERT
jgi:hypothetical protein